MNKNNDGRRKVLKSIVVGSGAVVTGRSLPESWSKPIVDSVLLPAHAETSQPSYTVSIQAYDESFTTELIGGPPTVPIGSTVNFLFTTVPATPGAVLSIGKYVNGVALPDPIEYTADGTGRVAIKATNMGQGLAAGDKEGVYYEKAGNFILAIAVLLSI